MANDGASAAPWHQPPQFHYRLGARRRQHAKGGSAHSQESESTGLLPFFSDFGINTLTGGPAQKAILIRNAAAANLCKCKERALGTLQTRQFAQMLWSYTQLFCFQLNTGR